MQLIERHKLKDLTLLEVVNWHLGDASRGNTHTFKAKAKDLEFLIIHCQQVSTSNKLLSLTSSVIEGFIVERLKAGEEPSTVCRRIATIKRFCRWCENWIIGYHSPAREVKGPVYDRKPVKGLSDEEAYKIYLAAERVGEGWRQARNKVLVGLLMFTGLRPSEVLNISEANISEDGQWLEGVVCKAKRIRRLHIDPRFQDDFRHWLKVRSIVLRTLFGVSNTVPYPILISTSGARIENPDSFRLTYKSEWMIIQRAAELAGSGKVNPHLFRHGFVMSVLEATRDVRLACQAVGHRSVNTTMVYTERQPEELAQRVIASRRFHG